MGPFKVLQRGAVSYFRYVFGFTLNDSLPFVTCCALSLFCLVALNEDRIVPHLISWLGCGILPLCIITELWF